ncbi:hypothetical protein BDR26DRAFT_1011264 [Obelidium mucronatum]|nr:hypothetical protein BDR26DRAFT_1011264 [Obelidium mucronatum]
MIKISFHTLTIAVALSISFLCFVYISFAGELPQRRQTVKPSMNLKPDETVIIPPSKSLVHKLEPENNNAALLRFNFPTTGCPPPKLALIGILTVPKPMNLLRQQLLRRIYLNETRSFSRDVDFKFVFGSAKPTNDTATQQALELQKLLFPDETVILACVENMNKGKSFEWWKAARNLAYMRHPTNPTALCPRYEYIGKTDDDVVIHIERLQNFLHSLEKTEDPSYIGTMQIRGGDYMSGILHFLSVSLVEYITVDDHDWNEAHKVGYEDKQTGEFVNHTGVQVRKISTRRIHDYEDTPNWTKALTTNQSIAVHHMKDQRLFYEIYKGLLESDGLTLELALEKYAARKNLTLSPQGWRNIFTMVKDLGLDERGMIEPEWVAIQKALKVNALKS